MRAPETNQNADVIGLDALAWTLGDPARARRLLDVTGLTPADLRARADDGAVQTAVLGFLEAHEPDLVACAADLDTTPERLVAARRALEA